MFSHSVRSFTRRSAPSLHRRLLQACVTHNLQSIPHPCSATPKFRRHMSTPAPQINDSHLSIEDYHAKADHAMEALLDTLEGLLDSGDQPDWEVDYHSGVLTLKLGSNGTYVINKQPPNKQIWLSSPKSGPKRYDFHQHNMEWVYSRDGQSMNALLSEELGMVFKEPVKFRL